METCGTLARFHEASELVLSIIFEVVFPVELRRSSARRRLISSLVPRTPSTPPVNRLMAVGMILIRGFRYRRLVRFPPEVFLLVLWRVGQRYPRSTGSVDDGQFGRQGYITQRGRTEFVVKDENFGVGLHGTNQITQVCLSNVLSVDFFPLHKAIKDLNIGGLDYRSSSASWACPSHVGPVQTLMIPPTFPSILFSASCFEKFLFEFCNENLEIGDPLMDRRDLLDVMSFSCGGDVSQFDGAG